MTRGTRSDKLMTLYLIELKSVPTEQKELCYNYSLLGGIGLFGFSI